MAGETSAPARTRFTGRVRLVLLCAVGIVVFLAFVMPGAFNVRHEKRSFEITAPVERLVLDSKGTAKVDISLSHDGHVHVLRSSAISRDSRLVEKKSVSGKTLTIRSSCTGSRLGVLRRCDIHYRLRVPRKIALSLHVHLGQTTIHGVQGRLEFRSDAGSFDGFGCNKHLDLSLTFGSVDYRNTCVAEIIEVEVKAADVALAVPAGRYDVHPGGRAVRPFENIIEDPSSPNEINVDIAWGGSVRITGVHG
jgi:hypothetical protein